MLEKVKAFIDRYQLIHPGDHLIVACSGGSDSVALLYLLVELSTSYPFSLTVAHVNHGLRGQEADKDEAYVRNLCCVLNLPFYAHQCDVQAFAIEHRLTVEEAGRIVRYGFFRQLAATSHSPTKIVTAHHKDDQAETVMMNLLRGSGSTGLKGILPQRGDLIRPLLAVTKQEIFDYLATLKVSACYDQTNGDVKILRNRIRICLLPQLELEYNNHIKDSLCRMAAILQDEQDFIDQSARILFTKLATVAEEKLFLSLALQEAHPALIRAVIRQAVEKKQGHLKGISFYHVEQLIKMLLLWPVSSCFSLPNGLLAYKNYENIEFTYERRQITSGLSQSIELNIPGETVVQELGIAIISRIEKKVPEQFSDEQAWFDYEQINLPIFVRSRCPGDRFEPLGFDGTKKVKDFLVDSKLPQARRALVPVVYNDQGILWLGSLRQSAVAAVTVYTKTYLHLSLGKQED
jgi:tRNA(Ile)-lysidine synthase